ncbi:MAG: transcription elongation factor GreA [Candidatus Saccharimonadales bacterium]
MKKQYNLTQAGVDELKAEHAELTALRSEIAERIKIARELGDLSENAEYQTARADQEKNDARLSEIEYILANSAVIKAPKSGSKKVVLGSKVSLKSEAGKTKEFQVVGTVEADPLEGKISDASPIGQALLGKKEGDEVEIKTPAETTVYVVTAIA